MQLPAWKAGPASLTSSIESGEGVVTATHRFATGPGVLTPAEAALVRAHLKETHGDYPLVTFRSAALVALEKGDVAEAFSQALARRKLEALESRSAQAR